MEGKVGLKKSKYYNFNYNGLLESRILTYTEGEAYMNVIVVNCFNYKLTLLII